MTALMDEDCTDPPANLLDAAEADVEWDAEADCMEEPGPDFRDDDAPLPEADADLEVPSHNAQRHSGLLPLGWVRHQVNHIEGRRSAAARHTAATMELEVAALWQRSLAKRITIHEPLRFAGGMIPRGHRWSTAHRSHALRVANTILFCKRCGKYAAWKVTRLRNECTDPATGSTDSQRRRLLKGQPPEKNKAWPGGAAHHTEWQVARVTVDHSVDDCSSESSHE